MRRLSPLPFVAAVMLAACASTPAPDGQPPSAGPTIRIVNRNWADMRVYVEHGGHRAFLGLVTTGTTASYDMPAGMGPGQLRLVAHPIGSTAVFATPPFDAAPDRTVEWTIRNRPALSGVTVH